jgi:PAS domain S-box-containing protein
MFGWPKDEIVDRPISMALTGELGAAKKLRELSASGAPPSAFEAVVRRRDGSTFLARVACTGFSIDGGRYLICLFHPAGEISSHEPKAAFIQTMIDSCADAILSTDANGLILTWNAAAERIYGFTAEEAIGKSILITVPPDRVDESEALRRRACSGEQIDDFRAIRMRKDGTRIDISLNVWPVYDESGGLIGLAGVTRNIADRVRLEARLEEARRLVAMGRLAATVAHEFNNVMMGIAPFADILLRTDGDPRVVNAAQHIKTALLRGKNITGEVLRFGRPSEPNLKRFDAVLWLRHVTDGLRSVLPPGIELDVRAPDAPLEAEADEHQLTQLLTNLVLNARDAMPKRAGRIGVTLSAGAEANSVELTVEDSGTGISDVDVKHVFEPLYTTKANGTGLGLPVARQIALRHGGDIELQSSASGTTFRVVLPILRDG